MTIEERVNADFRGTGVTIGKHPMAYRREELNKLGVKRAIDLHKIRNGVWVRVAGWVIVRQRPGTAKGFVFLSLEDETGIANAIIRPALFERDRAAIVHEPYLYVEGILQHRDGVTAVRATRVRPLPPMRGLRSLPRLLLACRCERDALDGRKVLREQLPALPAVHGAEDAPVVGTGDDQRPRRGQARRVDVGPEPLR